MKQLKYHEAIACTCHRTGLTGDFLIDKTYFKETGELASLDDKVFSSLYELYTYTNACNYSTGRIRDKHLPTFWGSVIEIKKLIEDGVNVYWQNEGYIVSNAHDGLHITYKYNGYYSKLQENEYKDCFIQGLNK